MTQIPPKTGEDYPQITQITQILGSNDEGRRGPAADYEDDADSGVGRGTRDQGRGARYKVMLVA
jgi:hypothetical protein